MPIEKTKLNFEFDSDLLKELRKVLFQKGLAPQQFFAHVAELVSLRDERMFEIMEEAVQHRKDYPSKGRGKNKTDAEMIYKLIEQELEKKQQNGA